MNQLESIEDGTYVLGASGLEDIETPTSGYWVGIRSIETVDDAKPYDFVGVWTDQKDGQRYYDITTYEINLDKALELGRQYNQISIWDIAKGEAIYL
jgi:hypothetical protein